ncbi:MAG: ion transporter [Proteobacteria bacterium]|nr:ion transporter [Pseudomonadota bacterium]
MLDSIHEAFHRRTARSYAVVEALVWVLVALSILLVFAEVARGEPLTGAVAQIDTVILYLFGIEIVLRVGSFRPAALDVLDLTPGQRAYHHVVGRLLFCLRPLVLVDIITVAAVVPALRGLRAVRLLRLLRSINFWRYSSPVQSFTRALQENVLLYTLAFSAMGVEVLVGGLTIFQAEKNVDSDIATIGDGMWWALVTITTVGYGDMTPISPVGKVIGGVLMVAGMVTLALFAGIIGQTLLNTVLSIREEQFRMSGHMNHLVICGYDSGARMLLDALQAERFGEETEVVIFAEGPRSADVPPTFAWTQGSPIKESELAKARIRYARALIIIGPRGVPPELADAQTILTLFTIRRYLRKTGVKRNEPLYIVAEILDAENVSHAEAAGADEVIETTRLGFSLMAHAITTPGSGQVISQVAGANRHNLYVDPLPASWEISGTFGEVAAAVRLKTGALVMGMHIDHEERLNPSDDALVPAGAQLIYLADKALLAVD